MTDQTNDDFSFKGVAPDDRPAKGAGSSPSQSKPPAPLPRGAAEDARTTEPKVVSLASVLASVGNVPAEPAPVANATPSPSALPPAPVPAPRSSAPAGGTPNARPAVPQPPLVSVAGDPALGAGGAPSAPSNPGAAAQPSVPAPAPISPAAALPAAPLASVQPVVQQAPQAAPQPVPVAAVPAPPRDVVTVEYEGAVPGDGSQGLSPRHQVQSWLKQMVDTQASDLILRSGGRPSQRLDGRISFLEGRVPGPGPMLEVLRGILGDRRMEQFEEFGAADAALDLDGLGRFRINAYKQMGEPAIVIRRINEDAPSLDDLNLPAPELKELAMKKRGLVLVTGVAGSGKSTTLSAMIEFMNRNVERHVVTLEDPVELLFKERYCVISQREVGTDTTSFKQGLKHALRQSPDVILIGEMRDAETVIAALEAVETGHLVMSTMHTVNAAQTVDRILGFFPSERHTQIRQRMGDNLAGVLSMRLVPRIGGGQVPAFELMQVTPQVKELLEEGKTTELGRVIQSGMEKGIVAFNDCLLSLAQSGMVDIDDAVAASDRPDELIMMLRGIQGGVRGAAKAQAPNGAGSTHGAPDPAGAHAAAATGAPEAQPPGGPGTETGRRRSDPGGGAEGRALRRDSAAETGGALRMRSSDQF